MSSLSGEQTTKMAGAIKDRTLVIYCVANALSEDLVFEPLIEETVKYGVPLAQIATKPLWESNNDRWVDHNGLKVLCPEGRAEDEVLALVKRPQHTALVLETNDPDGAFVIHDGDRDIRAAERLSAEPTVITGDIGALNTALGAILDYYEIYFL